MGKATPTPRVQFPVGPVSPEDFKRLETLGVIDRLERPFGQAVRVSESSSTIRLLDGIVRSLPTGAYHRIRLEH